MLQGVSVDAHDADGGRPLVVLLVEALVEAGLMEQPAEGEKMSPPPLISHYTVFMF